MEPLPENREFKPQHLQVADERKNGPRPDLSPPLPIEMVSLRPNSYAKRRRLVPPSRLALLRWWTIFLLSNYLVTAWTFYEWKDGEGFWLALWNAALWR